jgi:DNA-3-methyladenine glycosylase II
VGVLEPVKHTDTFRALATSIIFQQLAGNAATSILKRFISIFYPEILVEGSDWSRSSDVFPTPVQVLSIPVTQLKEKGGLSTNKANFIYGLAEKYRSGELSDELLRTASEDEIRELLLPVKGVGRWTVDMWVPSSCRPSSFSKMLTG